MAVPTTVDMRVVRVVDETPQARSLVLEPVEAAESFDYRPGQFVTVRIPGSGRANAARCYSLCSSPHSAEKPRITIKRVDDGYGSNWICDNAAEGTTLTMMRPSGTFTPDSLDRDLLLLAAGSGITPVMSILKSCLWAGTGSVTLVYANRDEHSVIFRAELVELAERFPERLTVLHWLESVQGLPTERGLHHLVAPCADRDVFVCGPEPFMTLASTVLVGLDVADDRVAVERFSSLAGDPFAVGEVVRADASSAGEVEVELDGRTRCVSWPSGDKLLDVLLDAGVDAPYSCREGACSACACMLVEGEVTLERNEVLDQRDLDDGLILACQAKPVTARVKVTYDA